MKGVVAAVEAEPAEPRPVPRLLVDRDYVVPRPEGDVVEPEPLDRVQ